MPFKSLQPDISLPTTLTIWDFLFTSPIHSPLHNVPRSSIAGYTNALTSERLSYADVRDAATHLSTSLVLNHGLRPGDTVALFSQNTIWYPVAMLAVLRAGGVVSGASPAYNAEEMTYALKVSGARFLMTHPSSMGVAVEAAEKAGVGRERLFLLEGEMEGFLGLKGLIEEGRERGEEGQVEAVGVPEGKGNGDVCGFLSFSSGTTGLPKAVCFFFFFFSSPSCCSWMVSLWEFFLGEMDGLTKCGCLTGHDLPPERDSAMSPDPTDHPSRPQKSPSRPPVSRRRNPSHLHLTSPPSSNAFHKTVSST